MKSVTIVSGGLDSVTLAYFMKSKKYDQTILTFDYGQRHKKEIQYAKRCAGALLSRHIVVDLMGVGANLRGSALTDQRVGVPEGHYSADNMATTVVPNRNAIMLSIAWGIAASENADAVAYGAHRGDYSQYADCRPEFVSALQNAFLVGTVGCRNPQLRIYAPFLEWSKRDIVELGIQLKVPFKSTWSCYVGGEKACGRCGTDVERLEAFSANHFEDPIEYEDREYWKTVTKEVGIAREKL